jgi:hypothetical protein
MIAGHKPGRFLCVKLFIGSASTVLLTYLSLAIADHDGIPQPVRYLLAPGYVLGMHFASGSGLLDLVGSFMRIALTANIIYYGLLSFLVLRKIN